MNIWRMDYFIADFLDGLLDTGHTQKECDERGEEYSKQIHECINSIFWVDEWMNEDFGIPPKEPKEIIVNMGELDESIGI